MTNYQLSKIMIKTIIIAVMAICLNSALKADTTTYIIEPAESNLVEFTSEAPVEKIVGTTNQITGEINIDPDDLSQPITAWFEVDAASIDTKNRIRNGHMRKNHLHTDKYPKIRYDLKSIEGIEGKFPADQKVEFTATGEFHLHGITKTIQPKITAEYLSSENAFEILAEFQVPLDEYEIPLPQFLILKVANVHELKVKFRATQKQVDH